MERKEILKYYADTVTGIKEAGLFKGELPIVSSQSAHVKLSDGREVLNMCANNYLGLGDSPRLIEAAKKTYDERGYGVASVRFICGTQDIHKQLEAKISSFLKTDDTILYSSCFDANGGLFETLLGPEDAVISDELNHASIIDGVRLCKAKRYRYKNNDMADLEAKLKMMITPGFHRKVACLRSTGMKIMDRTGINGYVPFAGIFYAEGEDLNIFLRELENPEHTNWSDTRPKTKEKKARAKKVLLEILHFMKESLDAMRLIETGKAINLSLGNYLADEGDEKDDQQKQEGINDEITSIIFKQINIAEKKTDEGQEGSGETAQVAEDAEEGDHKKTDVNGGGGTPNDTQGGTGGGSGGSGEGKVPAYEEAEPGKGNKKLVQIPATRTRFICKDKENGVYRLVYVPKISAHDVKLNLFLSAETQNYDAELLSVRCDKYPEAKIAGNIVEGVEFVAGEPLIIEVGINHHDYCSLEVKASGYTS